MITAQEAATGIYGAWRLAKGDRRGLEFFDDTEEAFWRSFYAAAIVAPIYILLIAFRLSEAPVDSGPVRIFLVEGTNYVCGWVAFPLAMYYLSDAMSRNDQYFRYIIAYNWTNVIVYSVWAIVALISVTGILPQALAAILGVTITLGVLVYRWYIARVGLEVGGGGAALVVVVDVFIELIFNGIAHRML